MSNAENNCTGIFFQATHLGGRNPKCHITIYRHSDSGLLGDCRAYQDGVMAVDYYFSCHATQVIWWKDNTICAFEIYLQRLGQNQQVSKFELQRILRLHADQVCRRENLDPIWVQKYADSGVKREEAKGEERKRKKKRKGIPAVLTCHTWRLKVKLNWRQWWTSLKDIVQTVAWLPRPSGWHWEHWQSSWECCQHIWRPSLLWVPQILGDQPRPMPGCRILGEIRY